MSTLSYVRPRRRAVALLLSPLLFALAPAVCAAADDTPAPVPAALPHLELRSDPYRPAAGEAAALTVTVKPSAGSADAVPADASLNLYLVRDDLGAIYFEEPKRADDGTFGESFTFPSGGEWHAFGEVVPAQQGATRITDTSTVTVDGARPIRATLVPQVMPVASVTGYTLALKTPAHITAGGDQKLTFSLRDVHGQPVTDTDLWHGAIAHLVLVDRDGKILLHALPDPDDPRTGRTEYLIFSVHFPKDGIWRGWVLFQRGGQQTTIPLAFRVSRP